MKRLIAVFLLLALFALCACGGADLLDEPTEPPTAEISASPAPEAAAVPVPETTAAPASSAEPAAAPEPTPDLSPLPDEWFDDAVFFGDSVTVTLGKYCLSTGDLGMAQILGEYSFSMQDALDGHRKVWLAGKPYLPTEAVPLTGARKVFVLLGNNDLAYNGGVDELMERWDAFSQALREQSPEATLFIQSALPVFHAAEREGWNNALFDEYNARLRAFCQEQGWVFVDLAPYFKDETNCLNPDYCSDSFCHLTQDALGIWVEQLKNPANYSVDPRSFDHD